MRKNLLIAVAVLVLLTSCGTKSDTQKYDESQSSSTNVESTNEVETEMDQEHYSEISVDANGDIFEYLGKNIADIPIFSDITFDALQTDEDTYWFFPQSTYQYKLDKYSTKMSSTYAVFANGTNHWESSDNTPVSYYYIDGSSIEKVFPDIDVDNGTVTLDVLSAYFGTPVYEEKDTVYVFDHNDQYYVTAVFDSTWDVFEYYVSLKEDICYVSSKLTDALGQPNKCTPSTVVSDGAVNNTVHIYPENGNLTFNYCGKLFSLSNIPENWEICVNAYSVDDNGVYNVNGISFQDKSDYSYSFELPRFYEYEDKVYPFYSDLISNDSIFEIKEETEEYIIYKADAKKTFSGSTSDYCIFMKDYGCYVTAYGLYKDLENESLCMDVCQSIAEYFENNVSVE